MSAQVGAGIYTAVHANYSDSGYVDRPDGVRCSSEQLRADIAGDDDSLGRKRLH